MRRFESGARSVHTELYHFATFPRGLIGPVEIIWQPGKGEKRRVWMRIHPSIFVEVWDSLKLCLKDGSTATMKDLRLDLDAFEIMGPRAGKVLARVVKVCKSDLVDKAKSNFVKMMASLDDAAQLPDGIVAGLRVYDPRLHFPPKRSTVDEAETSADGVLRASMSMEPSSELATSELWDEEIREGLAKPRYKKSDLDRRRQKLAQPGTRLRPMAQDDRIPLIIIQRSIISAASPSESFHGFTLLLPKGWAMYFLSSIIYSSLLVGGVNERRVQYREAGLPCFPEGFSGVCKAGIEWEKEDGMREVERWEKKPPSKRPSWEALGTQWPWWPNWNAAATGDEEEERALNGVPTSLTTESSPWLLPTSLARRISSTAPSDHLFSLVNTFRSQRSLPPLPIHDKLQLYTSALVHVKLVVLGRGSPGKMAVIYSLSASEREEWLQSDMEDQNLGELRPDPVDIIGFTSSGNFSMTRGRGHAVGTVRFAEYMKLKQVAKATSRPELVLVKVRDRDGVICRLAAVDLV
ncbi:ribonuclease P/MRP protein subunit POP1, partial [Tremellales sp. Uapishka_1]